MNTCLSIVIALSAVAATAGAQERPDANLGKQIATSGAPGVASCASCHGAQGEGMEAANYPRIGGQPQAYLARQLRAYADGSRANAIMGPIAKALSPQQIDAVSAYYASLPPPKQAAPKAGGKSAEDKSAKRGEMLASIGDGKIQVQACGNCHGPGGTGEPPNYPYLAGQHRGYLITSLNEWKSGARKTDPSGQMNMIAQRLSDEDIAAVASFYSMQTKR